MQIHGFEKGRFYCLGAKYTERERKIMENIYERLDNLPNTADNLSSKLNQVNRTRCWQMFFKIGVLENFATFTGKHLCWSFFLRGLQLY